MQTIDGYYYMDSLGEKNDRSPLVLIHGAGGSHLTWPVGMRRMKDRRVISIDLPGHGHSDGSACGSVQEYAKSLNAFFKAASIYKAVLVGYSLGAAIALQFAIDHPDQVDRLGLIACSGAAVLPDLLFDLFSDPASYSVGMKLFQEFVLNMVKSETDYRRYASQLFSARRSATIADLRAYRNFHFPDPGSILPGLPIWVCVGREDKINPVRSTQLLGIKRPGTTLSLINNAGHGVPVEQPAALTRECLRFLK